jgi:hypothetical protein
MANILQRLGAFRNKAITHSIETDNGLQEFRFYPPRMRMLLSGRMREILEPITQAMSVLFSDRSGDASRQQEVEVDGRVTTYVQGLNPEVIALRQEKRAAAVKDAMAAILNDNTRYQLGELLADSMRDDFSSDEGTRAQEVRQFMDEVDLPTIFGLMQGYFEALKPVLDKSGNSIFSGLQETVSREVKKALSGVAQDGDDGAEENNVLPMQETRDETN